mgnify:CR=1 FL=1
MTPGRPTGVRFLSASRCSPRSIGGATLNRHLVEFFDRGGVPDVLYAGMMEYDGDLHIPPEYLVEPPAIEGTVSEFLVSAGVSQLAVAETQKFGHVTYFFNGNRSGKFDDVLEEYIEIPSDRVPF